MFIYFDNLCCLNLVLCNILEVLILSARNCSHVIKEKRRIICCLMPRIPKKFALPVEGGSVVVERIKEILVSLSLP